MNGCAPHCCQSVHNINILDIIKYHNYFEELSRQAKQKWLLDYFNTHSTVTAIYNNESEISFFICGKQVCQTVWISTLGISTSNFYGIRKKFLTGCVSVIKDTQRSPLQRTSEAIAWMTNYFNLIGDHLPHRMVIHLPSSLTKVNIYNRMIAEFEKWAIKSLAKVIFSNYGRNTFQMSQFLK